MTTELDWKEQHKHIDYLYRQMKGYQCKEDYLDSQNDRVVCTIYLRHVYEHQDGSKSLKLGDFGLATVVDGPLYTVCGTPTYVAPEIIAETGYGLKVDIWAAGVITYILLCGFPPFRGSGDDQEVLFDQILMGQVDFPSPYWDNVSESAKVI
ncbi:unnamed protein product [Ranitomeya imitator]|uniref:Protein kinase domain-containing protein n=1 Tax=Ranitomeya imitator TaxID=111125 RepID=A0ABN9KX42_9NEOB|nr:unnamed protein product [Ranitomeya imitator]